MHDFYQTLHEWYLANTRMLPLGVWYQGPRVLRKKQTILLHYRRMEHMVPATSEDPSEACTLHSSTAGRPAIQSTAGHYTSHSTSGFASQSACSARCSERGGRTATAAGNCGRRCGGHCGEARATATAPGHYARYHGEHHGEHHREYREGRKQHA